MGSVTVGSFSLDGWKVTGPADYMRERFPEFMERLYSGRSVVFNYAVTNGSNSSSAVLTALQTDYSEFLGMKRFDAVLRKGDSK